MYAPIRRAWRVHDEWSKVCKNFSEEKMFWFLMKILFTVASRVRNALSRTVFMAFTHRRTLGDVRTGTIRFEGDLRGRGNKKVSNSRFLWRKMLWKVLMTKEKERRRKIRQSVTRIDQFQNNEKWKHEKNWVFNNCTSFEHKPQIELDS